MDDREKSELIERTVLGIGQHDGSGYELIPNRHIAALPDEGFERLKNILAQPHAAKLGEEYEISDKDALRFQALHIFREHARILLFLAALILGALTLLPLDDIFIGAMKTVTVLQFLAILIAIGLTINKLLRQPYKAWHRSRAKAELARGNYFKEIVRSTVSHAIKDFNIGATSELPLALQKLEFIRRYHIELQYAYYHKRGNEHLENERARKIWIWVAWLMTLLASIPIGIFGVQLLHQYFGWFPEIGELFSSLRKQWDPSSLWFNQTFLALGTIAVGLEASITNLSRIKQETLYAMKYHNTANELQHLYATRLKAVRWQAVEDREDEIAGWFKECNDLIVSEHRDWQRMENTHLEPLPTVEQLAEKAA